MSKKNYTLVEVFGEDYEESYFDDWSMPDEWTVVEQSITDYNEGDVGTTYIVSNGKDFYSITQYNNSWNDFSEDYPPTIKKVVPQEKKVTVYVEAE